MKDFKQYVGNIVSAVIGAIIGFVLNIFFYVGPDVHSIKNNSGDIKKSVEKINQNISQIESKYLKLDNDGRECIVGYSAEISNNNVSVHLNNKFDLKRGDRIELTYLYGARKVSIECFVHFVENAPNKDSRADFFISKDNLDIFQIPKNEYSKGVFEMRFKKILNH
jgi:hypothetical protein